MTEPVTNAEEKPQKPKMSAEFLHDRAAKAATARWGKRFNWDEAPLDKAEQHLAFLREELERGSQIVRQRFPAPSVVKCHQCDREIKAGRWAQQQCRLNHATGLPYSIYFCTAACLTLFNRAQQGILDLPR